MERSVCSSPAWRFAEKNKKQHVKPTVMSKMINIAEVPKIYTWPGTPTPLQSAGTLTYAVIIAVIMQTFARGGVSPSLSWLAPRPPLCNSGVPSSPRASSLHKPILPSPLSSPASRCQAWAWEMALLNFDVVRDTAAVAGLQLS
jgi:hypothetical protein